MESPDGLVARFTDWQGLSADARLCGLGWRPVPLMEAGEVAAVAMVRGTEIHFAAAPAWRHRLVQRGRTRAFLAPLMERVGFLTTRSTGDAFDRFLTRLGFERTWTEGGINHWMLTALPFEKA